MLLAVAVALAVLLVGSIVAAMVHFGREPEVPSPRPDRDERVAVLEGGSGRGWD